MTLIQVNIPDSSFRYYFDSQTRERYVSVTKSLTIMAMGEAFYNWLRTKGEESKILTEMAQISGTKLHGIIETWIKTNTIPTDRAALDLWYDTQDLECSYEELHKLEGFVNFNNEYKPNYLETEVTYAISEIKVAGTIDIVCEIGNVIHIIDIKTGSGIHNNNKLQVAFQEMSYRLAKNTTNTKRALLHLKTDTKKKYNLQMAKNTLEHDYEAFKHAVGLWMWDSPKWATFLKENEPVGEVANA